MLMGRHDGWFTSNQGIYSAVSQSLSCQVPLMNPETSLPMTPTPAKARAFTVSDRGLRVSVRVIGTGSPVLLLNGVSRSMGSWVHVRGALRDRMVIMFDCPGIGASSAPGLPYTMSMLAGVAAKVLDAVGVQSADVVGYSHGGAVAQQFALTYPARVRRLVLVSTACGIGGIPGNGWAFARAISRRPGPHAPLWAWTPLGLMWQITAYTTWTSLPLLRSIHAPTLVIHGKKDRIVPVANARLLSTCIPNARMVTVDAGHDLQAPVPANAVARAIDGFLHAESP